MFEPHEYIITAYSRTHQCQKHANTFLHTACKVTTKTPYCDVARTLLQEMLSCQTCMSAQKHRAHLVLLKVIGQDVVLAKANAAGNGLLNAHDQPKQRALPAPIGACNA